MTIDEAINIIKAYTKIQNEDDVDIFVNTEYQKIDPTIRKRRLGEPIEVIVAEECFGTNSAGLPPLPESLKKLQEGTPIASTDEASDDSDEDTPKDYTQQVQDMFRTGLNNNEDAEKDKSKTREPRKSFIYEKGEDGMKLVGMMYGKRIIMISDPNTTPVSLYGKSIYRKGILFKFDQTGRVEVSAHEKLKRRKRSIQEE